MPTRWRITPDYVGLPLDYIWITLAAWMDYPSFVKPGMPSRKPMFRRKRVAQGLHCRCSCVDSCGFTAQCRFRNRCYGMPTRWRNIKDFIWLPMGYRSGVCGLREFCEALFAFKKARVREEEGCRGFLWITDGLPERRKFMLMLHVRP